MSQLHQIALTLLPNIGPATAKAMLSYCGSAEAIFSTSKSKLLSIPGIGPKTAEALKHDAALFARAEQELQFAEKEGISIHFYGDAEYPKRLKPCTDAPVLLYFKGKADLSAQKIISVVGTRKATDYGREICARFIDELSGLNITVVSGMAYGIDIAAHKACVKHDVPTIGVLAHGLDRLYPNQHLPVAKKMLDNGGLLTDFMSGTNPDRENFPERNRIIAGIADATIVVEAGEKGGALITAEIAQSYNREVFAFPGRVGDEVSAGCNNLIRYNKAGLITSAKDVLNAFGWLDDADKVKPSQLMLNLNCTPDERIILDIILQSVTVSIDDLALKTGLSTGVLASALLNLDMRGLIISLPGKHYKRSL